MNIFALVAGIVTAMHVVAAVKRPRLAVIASGLLWMLYTYYEHLIATGVLCDKDCNIRVDLVFFFPILGLAAFCAYRAYIGQPGGGKVAGLVLSVIILLFLALAAEGYGYGDAAAIGFVCALAGIIIYAIKTRSKVHRT